MVTALIWKNWSIESFRWGEGVSIKCSLIFLRALHSKSDTYFSSGKIQTQDSMVRGANDTFGLCCPPQLIVINCTSSYFLSTSRCFFRSEQIGNCQQGLNLNKLGDLNSKAGLGKMFRRINLILSWAEFFLSLRFLLSQTKMKPKLFERWHRFF